MTGWLMAHDFARGFVAGIAFVGAIATAWLYRPRPSERAAMRPCARSATPRPSLRIVRGPWGPRDTTVRPYDWADRPYDWENEA